MRRALVTGAHGLVGRWLVEALLERDVAVAVLRRAPSPRSALVAEGLEGRCRSVEGDLADVGGLASAIDGHGADTVFHLAAQSLVGGSARGPVPTFETNVRGTWNLLEACRLSEVGRVVVASSDTVYGPGAPLPTREDAPLDARAPYAVSKACADLVARSFAHASGLPVAVARLSNVYGAGDRNVSRLVPALAASVVTGRPLVIDSDGSPARDVLHAEDAAAAFLAIADALDDGAAGEAFNVGGDDPRTVREVVDLFLEVAGSDLEAEYRRPPGEGDPADPARPDRQWADPRKLRERTGWVPRTPLRDGLRRTLDWYRANPGALED